jgi:hypothetical protein
MDPDARAELQQRAEAQPEQEIAKLRGAETDADRAWAASELRRRNPNMSEADVAERVPVVLERRRLRRMARRERASLEVVQWIESMRSADTNRDPMCFAIPVRAIRQSVRRVA